MARKPGRKASRKSRKEDAKEESGSEYLPSPSEEEDGDEELEEDPDEDSDEESEPSEEVLKPRKGKSSLSRAKKTPEAEDSLQESDDDSLAFEYEVFVRKVRKGNPQKKSKGEWVPLQELKWLLQSEDEEKTEMKSRDSSDAVGGKRRSSQAGRRTSQNVVTSSFEKKDRTKRKAIVDLSEDEEGEPVGQQLRSGKWKAAKKPGASHKKRVLEENESQEETPTRRKRVKVSGTPRTKASRLVVGAEARSEDEETDARSSDSFIDDEEEDEEEEADVSNKKDDVSNGEVSEGEKDGLKQKRLQKLQGNRGASVPTVEFEDEPDQNQRRGSLRKNVIESDEEDEIVPTIARAKSPDIPLKEGLTQPVRLEIPEPGAENESGGEESQRKRRKVELPEDEEMEGKEEEGLKQKDESKELKAGRSQTEAQSMLDKDAVGSGDDKSETDVIRGAGQFTVAATNADYMEVGKVKPLPQLFQSDALKEQSLENGGKRAPLLANRDVSVAMKQAVENGANEGGFAGDTEQPRVEEEKGTEEEFHSANMQAGSEREESTEQNEEEGTEALSGRRARRRQAAEKPGTSILERMIDNRNATLGLIEKEEESEGDESGQPEDDNMDGFIEPDENGDDHGYNGGAEQEGSEGGVEDEGQPTGEDDFALPEGVFRTYLEYLLRTMQDLGHRVAARNDDELMRLVRRCEEALTSRRTLLVQSSVWKPGFKAALDSRPNLSANDTDNHRDCEACGRSNHPATHVMTFSGPGYRPRDVWEFDLAATPSSQLHRESTEVEQSELESFFVGKNCYARASVYHALHHYKWHLQKRLQRALDEFPAAMEEAAEELLSRKSFVGSLHRNFNGFVAAAEQYLERKEKRGGNLVTMEEVESATRFFELVEELQEGGIEV